ncbi:MAG: UPF0280 family protein [Thermodesulfobacteriota bacterium]|nr:UPF0280 family protein [Thermodesulfobacteriota bacterium]
MIKDSDMVSFNTVVKETDLCIWADSDLRKRSLEAVLRYRGQLERYIRRYPLFRTALEPVSIEDHAPPILQAMSCAAKRVSVGPMASVAGAIAEYVGKDLLAFSQEVVVENGGDIFLKLDRKKTIGIYHGQSSGNRGVSLEIRPEETPMGICTSSGVLGHSFSFGSADAVVALADSAILADVAATAIANQVKDVSDIKRGIEFSQRIHGLKGVVIIKDERMEFYGRVSILV